MVALFPEIDPYDSEMLSVGEGHLIYWEVCGNPEGKPVVVLHGGPGSGCSPRFRRFFDPSKYRIVLFDQRNCGCSQPHASEPTIDLATNTTLHLIGDMEQLRQYLNIEQWMLFGGSWGTTLALAYAQRYPQNVSDMLLYGVTTTRQSEIDWLYRDLAPMFPEQWQQFVQGVPSDKRDGDLVAAYYDLLHDDDPDVHQQAAKDWTDWDLASASVDGNVSQPSERLDLDYMLARARIVTHYFRHGAWLDDGILLKNAHLLSGIRGILVQGRLDLQAPLRTAWELAQVWDSCELIIVDNAGHAASDDGMTEAIVAATNKLVSV